MKTSTFCCGCVESFSMANMNGEILLSAQELGSGLVPERKREMLFLIGVVLTLSGLFCSFY